MSKHLVNGWLEKNGEVLIYDIKYDNSDHTENVMVIYGTNQEEK